MSKISQETMDAAIAARAAGDFQMRSCWKCNGAHEHLKNAGLIVCFACGHWYLNGEDLSEEGEPEPEP